MALSQSGHATYPEYSVDFRMFDCPEDSVKVTVWDSTVDVNSEAKLDAYLRCSIAHRFTGNYSDAAFIEIIDRRRVPEMR